LIDSGGILMDKKEKIKNLIIENTSFLKEVGYDNFIEKSDVWDYTLSYISSNRDHAIEFEVDYRDLDVFVLVTVLEDGKLPSGYYMNKGKQVRTHLEKLFESGKIMDEEWTRIIDIRKEQKDKNERKIIALMNEYSTILKKNINNIQKLCSNEE